MKNLTDTQRDLLHALSCARVDGDEAWIECKDATSHVPTLVIESRRRDSVCTYAFLGVHNPRFGPGRSSDACVRLRFTVGLSTFERLREAGYLEQRPSGRWVITDEGCVAVRTYDPAPRTPEEKFPHIPADLRVLYGLCLVYLAHDRVPVSPKRVKEIIDRLAAHERTPTTDYSGLEADVRAFIRDHPVNEGLLYEIVPETLLAILTGKEANAGT